jgi:putative ABC transport system substrate-binding protein
MRRREFIVGLGSATAWPLAARAQNPTVPVVGFLNGGSKEAEAYVDRVRAFREGLSETGHVEGRNLVVEYRWADGQYDRLPAMAADLVRRRVAVIFVNGPGVEAVKTATSTIPVVFLVAVDPVKAEIVSNLSRPGSNLTGCMAARCARATAHAGSWFSFRVVTRRLAAPHERIRAGA